MAVLVFTLVAATCYAEFCKFQVVDREEQFNRALCRFSWYRRLYPRRCRWSSEAAEESDEVCVI